MSDRLNGAIADPSETSAANELLVAYRHDVHKLTGDAHDHADETFAGVPVNDPVPHGADSDAAALSRPAGQPQQTVEAHGSHYRLSLCTGQSQRETVTGSDPEATIRELVTESDPEAAHRAWLTNAVVGAFNESVYYPYTSLKYHTLLVGALVDNYRAGYEFDDLALVVDLGRTLVPYRTIYADEVFCLRIAPAAACEDRPFARLGSHPQRSWAAIWQRLPVHPLATDADEWARALDANLRRIRSWSTALQYLDDVRDGGEWR